MTKHIATTDVAIVPGFFAYIYRDPSRVESGYAEPFYVGKGSGRRHRDHLYRKNKSPMTHRVQKMLKENIIPSIEVIQAIDEQHALFIESCLIEVLGRKDLNKGPLLNLTDGGDGQMKGFRHSAETKAKMSATRKGRSNYWLKGKNLSEEHKAKLRKVT